MKDPPENQELIDTLIAISVVARHLARKLEEQRKEEQEVPEPAAPEGTPAQAELQEPAPPEELPAEARDPAAAAADPAPEPRPEEPPAYKKEDIRAMLAALAVDGHRDEAKALVAKYADGGSLSGIDPARYPEIAEEVRTIHG